MRERYYIASLLLPTPPQHAFKSGEGDAFRSMEVEVEALLPWTRKGRNGPSLVVKGLNRGWRENQVEMEVLIKATSKWRRRVKCDGEFVTIRHATREGEVFVTAEPIDHVVIVGNEWERVVEGTLAVPVLEDHHGALLDEALDLVNTEFSEQVFRLMTHIISVEEFAEHSHAICNAAEDMASGMNLLDLNDSDVPEIVNQVLRQMRSRGLYFSGRAQ